MTKKTGTKEWAAKTVNCITGCSNNCRYCYARHNAVHRFGYVKSEADWKNMIVRQKDVRKKHPKYKSRVMFPSTHDITPDMLDQCMDVLRNLLEVGNEVLIVSKPDLWCIEAICDEFRKFRKQIMFRFSIGCFDDTILGYWEPGAPNYIARRSSLRYAWDHGFTTSVSCEPLLDSEWARLLYHDLLPDVTDTIWIGKMNHVRQRAAEGTSEEEIQRIEAGQTDEAVMRVYEQLKDEPKVRWKDSYREVIERMMK